jgi:hypothetical protein
MNSGLINGPVQSQKNGRWRRWECAWPGSNDTATAEQPGGFSRIVPVPSFVSAVRVSAVASSIGDATTSSGGGGACKNVLLSVANGRRIHTAVRSFNGTLIVGVLRAATENVSTAGVGNYDWGIELTSGFGNPRTGGSARVYRRGVQVLEAAGSTGLPNLLPFNGGSLVSGFASTSGHNPLDPQSFYNTSNTDAISLLFGGPQIAGSANQPANGLPGHGLQIGATDYLAPAYILVEWVE